MIDIQLFLQVILFVSLIILVVALIIAVVKAIGVLNQVNELIVDIKMKSNKLNGAFDIADNVTSSVIQVADKIGGFISDKVNSFVKKRKDDDNE